MGVLKAKVKFEKQNRQAQNLEVKEGVIDEDGKIDLQPSFPLMDLHT